MLPELGMKFPIKGSFNEVCIAFQRLIRANPGPAQKAGWPAADDFDAVADWVDGHNASRLLALGYVDFVDDGTGADVFYDAEYHNAQKKTSLANVAGRLSAGAALWAELFGPAGRTVQPEIAERRAAVCAVCPKNDTATSLFNIFVAATARALGGLFSMMKENNLSTSYDDRLGVCTACLCPMKSKVFVELPQALKHMDEATLSRLHEDCWILKERKPVTEPVHV